MDISNLIDSLGSILSTHGPLGLTVLILAVLVFYFLKKDSGYAKSIRHLETLVEKLVDNNSEETAVVMGLIEMFNEYPEVFVYLRDLIRKNIDKKNSNMNFKDVFGEDTFFNSSGDDE